VLWGLTGCTGEHSQLQPASFSIEVHTYNTSWRPAQWLRIRGDGSASYVYYPPGIDQEPLEKSFILTPAQTAKIQKVVNRIKFFELDPQYVDQRWPRGWNCEITVRMNGNAHKVHVIEAEVKPIVKLLKTINSVTPLPKHMKFLYYVVF